MITCAFLVTVTSAVAVLPPSTERAVIVAVPGDTAVTVPPADTVADSGFDDVQVIARLVASDGVTVAVSTPTLPGLSVNVAGATEMPVTATEPVTVTSDVAVRFPSAVVAVMVADPGAVALTTPVALTVATAELDVVHVTLGFVAVAGVTVAVSCVLAPTATLTDVGLTLTPVTGVGAGAEPRRAAALMMPAPHVFARSASQRPPGKPVAKAEDFTRVSTCAGVRDGFCESIKATTPET